MRSAIALFLGVSALLALVCVSGAPVEAKQKPPLDRQVFAAESSFAHTMAARDFDAFGAFVSSEAIFFGRRGAQRGKSAVLQAWKPFFGGPEAPFSWRPEVVEVLESGKLALSSGPVSDPAGKLIGMFSSIWRLESDGRWRVIFDKGCPVCDSTRAE